MGYSNIFEDRELCDCTSGKNGNFVSRFAMVAAGLILLYSLLPLRVAAQGNMPSKEPESSIQLLQPPTQGQPTPPITITLKDALERARKNDPMYLSAVSDAKSATEDRIQARNAMLPKIEATTQYLGTQGDGGKISDGRFVTNDG
ncbi:MAG: TolC family protein, partial [Candidatus Acidoferrum typicum]|nr:TolC family protein [Candidatus Acidoferrum typicum]